MDQPDLFKKKLSVQTLDSVGASITQLYHWGMKESVPHVKSAVLEYFRQLETLMKTQEITPEVDDG